jgi:DTW domain-containing protein YfiP
MKPVLRLPVQIGITTALAVVLSFAIPVSVDRRAYARAVVNYVNNPSAENEAILSDERAQNQRIVRTTHLEAAGLLVVLMNTGWFLIRKWPRKSPSLITP